MVLACGIQGPKEESIGQARCEFVTPMEERLVHFGYGSIEVFMRIFFQMPQPTVDRGQYFRISLQLIIDAMKPIFDLQNFIIPQNQINFSEEHPIFSRLHDMRSVDLPGFFVCVVGMARYDEIDLRNLIGNGSHFFE